MFSRRGVSNSGYESVRHRHPHGTVTGSLAAYGLPRIGLQECEEVESSQCSTTHQEQRPELGRSATPSILLQRRGARKQVKRCVRSRLNVWGSRRTNAQEALTDEDRNSWRQWASRNVVGPCLHGRWS